jgi:CRP-like cAMP-binding protein
MVERQQYENGHHDAPRASQILPQIPYFVELEKSIPGFMETASYVAEFHKIPKGVVLFREHDPPACLYYLISGEVGVYVHRKKDMNGNAVNRPPTPRHRPKQFHQVELDKVTKFLQRLGLVKVDDSYERAKEKDRMLAVILQRSETYEQFSTVAEGSSFGDQVATLPAGSTIGDSALKNDIRRTATIKCLEDCEFLRVHKNDFDVRLCDKISFFKTNVPGFMSYTHVGEANKHPAACFMDVSYQKGHEILKEGVVGRPAIIAIREGEVTFRRKLRSKVGVNGTHGYRTWLVLGPGDVLCTLGMLEMGNVEPCTATVTSIDFKGFIVSGNSSRDYMEIPRPLFNHLLDHVRSVMKPVFQLSDAFAGLNSYPVPGEGCVGRARLKADAWCGPTGEVVVKKERPPSKSMLDAMRRRSCKNRTWGKYEVKEAWESSEMIS